MDCRLAIPSPSGPSSSSSSSRAWSASLFGMYAFDKLLKCFTMRFQWFNMGFNLRGAFKFIMSQKMLGKIGVVNF